MLALPAHGVVVFRDGEAVTIQNVVALAVLRRDLQRVSARRQRREEQPARCRAEVAEAALRYGGGIEDKAAFGIRDRHADIEQAREVGGDHAIEEEGVALVQAVRCGQAAQADRIAAHEEALLRDKAGATVIERLHAAGIGADRQRFKRKLPAELLQQDLFFLPLGLCGADLRTRSVKDRHADIAQRGSLRRHHARQPGKLLRAVLRLHGKAGKGDRVIAHPDGKIHLQQRLAAVRRCRLDAVGVAAQRKRGKIRRFGQLRKVERLALRRGCG